jgi:multisubunit Na+/H+ antiporter MnhF subunit
VIGFVIYFIGGVLTFFFIMRRFIIYGDKLPDRFIGILSIGAICILSMIIWPILVISFILRQMAGY